MKSARTTAFLILALFFAHASFADDALKNHYSRPLLFAPEDNKIGLTSPQLNWVIGPDGRFTIGGLLFDSNQIQLIIDQKPRDQVPSRLQESDTGSLVTNISFSWPSAMTETGTIRIIDRDNRILWSHVVEADEDEKWQENIKNDDKNILTFHKKSRVGYLDIDIEKYPFLKRPGEFRFCLDETKNDAEKIKICTGFYKLEMVGRAYVLKAPPETTATVLSKELEIGPKGVLSFAEDKIIPIEFRFKNGVTIEFTSKPAQVKFLDITWSADEKNILLTGQGAKPYGKLKDLEVPPNHFWSATGFPEEVIWQLTMPRDAPTVKLVGTWNIPFLYLMKFEKLPNETDRLFLSSRTGSGTYKRTTKVFVYSPRGDRIGSKEFTAKKRNAKEIVWYFTARDKDVSNKSRIMVQMKGDKKSQIWTAHYKLYRGYPGELGLRMSAVAANNEPVFIGDVALSYWFETLFNNENYYLSHQRWGITARRFQALKPIVITAERSEPFTTTTLQLRYNILPGLWNRDEMLGLIGSYQPVQLAGYSPAFIGVGAFWARTMPKVFDDFFNLLPFFRYRKYCDVEFTVYPAIMKNDLTPGYTFDINFHGKVFWTRTFFGEAGFGFKRYDFVDKKDDQRITIGSAFGTAGLGIIF